MNFGEAIEEMKKGALLARKGWNGKGMYIFLEEDLLFSDHEGHVHELQPCIIMFTAGKTFQPGWLASQEDILAEDWEIKEI